MSEQTQDVASDRLRGRKVFALAEKPNVIWMPENRTACA